MYINAGERMSNIVRGTMLLTAASFLSKFLGMIYLIPFNALVGETGGTLYGYAYTPYSIFISLATIGIPMAVSKFVSRYNSLGDFETGIRMFKAGSIMMAFTGLLAFLVLFLSAGILAEWMITNDDAAAITSDDVAFVIRMVSFALLIIPAMSIVRGFFQGYQSMGPTAVSQVIEQIVRIAFILVGAYVILEWLDGTIVTAVGFSTFAAFIGALASCIVLWMYFRKRKPHIKKQLDAQEFTYDIPTKKLLTELFRYAGPFVVVGLAIPIYQLIDQFTFERAMVASGRADEWVVSYAAVNVYGHKIVVIPMTIATGLSLAMIPAVTNAFTKKNMELVTNQINQALQIVLVLVIPAAAGIAVLSHEAYGALYGLNHIEITGNLLAWYAPVVLFFALFSVSSSILQGINEQRFAVYSLLCGVLVKVLFNIQLIHLFGAKGAIFGTMLASGLAVALNLWRIKTAVDFSYKQIIKRTILIGIFVIFMCIAIWLLKFATGFVIPYEDTRWATIVMLALGVAGGGYVYLWFAYKSTLLERVFGDKVRKFDRFF
jgi:O-antigen/teichoic acid export membrane protein